MDLCTHSVADTPKRYLAQEGGELPQLPLCVALQGSAAPKKARDTTYPGEVGVGGGAGESPWRKERVRAR